MKISDRSKKSQEAHADYLMKISLTMLTAFLVAILIVPIGAIIKTSFEPTSSQISLLEFLKSLITWKWLLFGILQFCILWIADNYRNRALDIYDSLEPKIIENE